MHKNQKLAQQENLLANFKLIRSESLKLTINLSAEDMQAQSMPDASPTKWHLAHTSWAFETFVLKPYFANYTVFDESFEYLFNSYYNAIGEQYPRAQRGALTRPNLEKILAYRKHIDQAVCAFIEQHSQSPDFATSECFQRILLMINHEQQHQELMLTDIKHLLSMNPLYPAYANAETLEASETSGQIEFEPGLFSIGHQDEAFYFDNEGPRHDFYVAPFAIQTSLVSNAEYLEFIQDNAYQTPAYWLSEAWQKINQQQICAPIYWKQRDGQWFEFTLGGLVKLQPELPVKHISYFEANAFANWKGKRLPTEQEWEIATRSNHPQLKQMYNQLWQWTSSSYSAYPGFQAETGAVGEYNGKFMVNQYVLRGGSCATPNGHIRASYRNFFYPDSSWQFSGIRLAESI